MAEGINRKGRFTGALLLTHNATSLILPGVANITTAANDRYEARSLGAGNWIVTKYLPAVGQLFDATVVHTTGNESIAGVKTFTSPVPIVLTGSTTNTVIEGRNTSVGVFGYWRMFLGDATFGRMYFQKNTAAAGDFSTTVEPLFFDGVSMTFNGTITASAGTVSTHVATKGQLDAKVFSGQIQNNGAASVLYGPTGWTVTRSSAGVTVVTHNLGTISYGVAATHDASGTSSSGSVNGILKAANTFQVETRGPSGAGVVDNNYHFVLSRN